MPCWPLATLHERRRLPEWMDQPDLPAPEHRRALRSLARINGISRCALILEGPLAAAAREVRPRPLRVLDLASGGGDVLLRLAGRGAARGQPLECCGCDISPVAVEQAAAQAAQNGLKADFLQLDVLRDPLPAGYDVVMCTLFLHHLEAEEAVLLLTRMRQAAARLVLVQDLVRSRRGYLLALLACGLLTKSPVVRLDGPRSVAGAFTVREASELAERAGLRNATIRRHWPQRFLLSWRAA